MSVDPFGGTGAKTLTGWHDFVGAIATRLPTRLIQTRRLVREANKTLAARGKKR